MLNKFSAWLNRNDDKLDYLQLLNYLVIVLIYLKFWIFPSAGSSLLRDSIHLFMVEFLMVVGSVFISVLVRTKKVFLLILIFGYLIYNLSKIFHNDYFFYAYLLLVFSRIKILFTGFDVLIFAKNIFYAVVSFILFMIAAFSMMFLNKFIPKFGLTEQFLNSSGYKWQMGGASGMMVERPETVMYFWVVYFSLSAVATIWVIRKKHEFKLYDFKIKFDKKENF